MPTREIPHHPLPMATTRLQPLRAEEHPGSGTPNLACKAKMRRSAAQGRGWSESEYSGCRLAEGALRLDPHHVVVPLSRCPGLVVLRPGRRGIPRVRLYTRGTLQTRLCGLGRAVRPERYVYVCTCSLMSSCFVKIIHFNFELLAARLSSIPPRVLH